MIISQAPYRWVVQEDGQIISDNIKKAKINGRLADAIMLHAASEMRALGLEDDHENFFMVMRRMRDREGPSVYKSTIHSLLVFLGDETTSQMKKSMSRRNDVGPEFYESDFGLADIYGAGYLFLSKRSKRYLMTEMNLTEDQAPALVHFGKDKTEQWLLVRQPEPKQGA